jgi:hypothetical protein
MAVADTWKQIQGYSPAQLQQFITSQGVAYHPGFICAETTTAVLKANGINTPDANTLAVSYKDFGNSVSPAQAQVGDTVYFTPYSSGTTGHVGVITGFNPDGTAIVHSGNGTSVEVSNVDLTADRHVGGIYDVGARGDGGTNPNPPDANAAPGGATGDGAGGSGTGAGGAAAGAGGAAGAVAGAPGGAGCMGGGLDIPKMLGMAGLMQNLGGVAANAAMSAGMALLSGGGIQGALGAGLGSAAGAFGNALGYDLGGAAGQIVGQTLGGALGAIVAGKSPVQALTGAAFGALSSMGGNLIPALSGVMPPQIASAAINGLTSALGSMGSNAPKGAAMQFAIAGGLSGAISSYVGNMTGNYAAGSVLGSVAAGAINGNLPNLNSGGVQVNAQLKFTNLIGTVSSSVSGNKEVVGAISEAMAMKFGPVNGGYGAKAKNMQDAMTFSVTTLGQNISAISADLIAMGTWNASEPMRLMQPGYVCQQILDKGLGEHTGLTQQLLELKLPVAGINNPLFDGLSQKALSNLNDPETISFIKSAFNMTTDITSLGDLTNLQVMMPTSKTYLPVHNFRELGIQFSIIGINTDTNMRAIGMAFSKIETGTDLNHISTVTSDTVTQVGQNLMGVYGYGGGTFGEQTMADFIGTAAGYVHTDTIPVITSSTEYIMNHPDAATLKDLTLKLTDTLNGKYTDVGTPGDDANGVPSVAASITVPGVGTFSSLDDAVLTFVPLIEAQQSALLASTDPALQDHIQKLTVAYNASCAQLVREANNLYTHNINLFDETPSEPSDAQMFMDSLETLGLQTGYGQPAEYIERVASNDLYGDSIKYVMRQARNAAALADLGINVDQYKLPQSQYYRNPEQFYQNLYTGNMPAKPQFRATPVYPAQPGDVYNYVRNKTLTPYNDIPLTSPQKDELYVDTQWTDVPTTIAEGIGRQVVKDAIDKYVLIVDNGTVIGSYQTPAVGSFTSLGRTINYGTFNPITGNVTTPGTVVPSTNIIGNTISPGTTFPGNVTTGNTNTGNDLLGTVIPGQPGNANNTITSNPSGPSGTILPMNNHGLVVGGGNALTPNQITDAQGNPIVLQDNKIMGADLLIVNLNGESVPFGKVVSNGLILLNNEYFVATMMQIVNKSLYGDISTTKYTNPFNTDQMIFGVLELLAQVTNQNIEALMRTITGGLIAGGLLSKLLAKFGTRRSLYDTGNSRNDPAVWGDSGPGANPYKI